MYVETGLGIVDLICELFCVCEDCAGDSKCMLEFMMCMCVLGWRLDISVGNCFRMTGVGWGLDTCLGNYCKRFAQSAGPGFLADFLCETSL